MSNESNLTYSNSAKVKASDVAISALEDKKASDIVSINLQGNSYTDSLVIATGSSERSVQALADNVQEFLHKAGFVAVVEGTPHNNWVVIDAGETVVHIFIKATRELYNLEKLYSLDEISAI